MLRKTTIVFVIALLAPFSTALAHGNLAFVNGLWFDGSRFVKKTMYSVEKTFRSEYDGPVQETVDLKGKYVIPPLADAHNHALTDPRTFDEQARRFLRAGIFYVANPNSVGRFTAELRGRAGTPETVDVTYANGGLTASGGHPIQIFSGAGHGGSAAPRPDLENDAYFVIDSRADLEKRWPLIVAGKPDFIKLYLEHSEEFEKRKNDPAYFGRRGLDPGLLRPIVERARVAGLRTACHVDTAADFHNAVAAGVDEIAHLPLEPIDPADAALAARQHAVVVTTILSHRPTPGLTDPLALHKQNLALLKRAGVTIAIGVDNPERNAVDEALAVAATGVFTPAELLRMWTGATALEIFPARKIGRLEDGWEASFIALDGNPLEDLAAVRKIALRLKQGHLLTIPDEKLSAADALLPIAAAKGVDAAIAEYGRLRKEKGEAYDFGERELNRLGYALLGRGDTASALRIFQLNAENFPGSSNVWDSLGEASMKAGRREEAIANYRKSLQLNPHNENAAKMLKHLEADTE